MSATRQAPTSSAGDVQARLDHLFRHHRRDDPAVNALRACLEAYRLASAAQAGQPAGTAPVRA